MTNSFGRLFRVTTWGESHGPSIGCVIDGCPAGLAISREEIQLELNQRRPGHNPYVSPRQESDHVEILSGVFEGYTTGAPISLLIKNQDADPSAYEELKDILRPGHATFTYLSKYGQFDHRGSGRASARETACRVAAGAIAKKILQSLGISIISYLKGIGSFVSQYSATHTTTLTPLFCLHEDDEQAMRKILEDAKTDKDSVGGVVECMAFHVPVGLGDPVYGKLEAELASAMMSLPASKAFEMGDGVLSSTMRGSEHNDAFCVENGKIVPSSNHAGGTLGGISTGAPIVCRIHFKPASSIPRSQDTVDIHGNHISYALPENARHDPCVAIRAVPVCRAMCALVLVDCYLRNVATRLNEPRLSFYFN